MNYKSTLLKIQHQFCFALDFNTIMLTLIVHENRANCKSIRCIEKILTFGIVKFSLFNSVDYRGKEGSSKSLDTFFKYNQYNCRGLYNCRFDACPTVESALV